MSAICSAVSQNTRQTDRLRLHCASRGRLTFSIAGPTAWNSLPGELRDPACGSDSFKQFLNTILFSLY